MIEYEYESIFCIVNTGFSELAMDAARSAGATGGTVIHARGTANRESEKHFNITIQPEKEIVMILVPKTIRDDVMHALYKSAGIGTDAMGIVFSMPADNVIGIPNKK